jgi:hypothetical protein
MKLKYHFALSFSGTCRREARAVAERLRDSGYDIFFDEWYEHEMLGLSGTEYLRHVYAEASRHCIVLIDQDYDQRKWTLFEREIIEARTLQEPSMFVGESSFPLLSAVPFQEWHSLPSIHCKVVWLSVRLCLDASTTFYPCPLADGAPVPLFALGESPDL